MGFDGFDPTLARRFMDAGSLPHLRKLANEGTFAKLGTTQPSESPVAWSSFMTGVNPGKHNIYGFLMRNVETYMPDASMGVKTEPLVFRWGLIPTKGPRVFSIRGGTPFWIHADRSGLRCVVLTVPMTFPVQHIDNGVMLAGLPLPDVRGTLGLYSVWATDLSSFEEESANVGGTLKRLLFDDGVSKTSLKGPINPILQREQDELLAREKAGTLSDKETLRLGELAAGKDVRVPITVRWTKGWGHAEIGLGETTFAVKAGEWSAWVPVTFPFNFLASAKGMTQFHVIRANEELRIYASPVNLDPRDPPVPISAPPGFSRRLVTDLGLYRTLGWAEPTSALNDGRLDEAAFMYDCERAFADRERMILKELDRHDWDLFVAAIETPDRVSHMMWRLIDPKHPMFDAKLAAQYGDSIEKVYRHVDDLVGKIEARLPPGVVFMVMSDHGFHSFRRSVNLNTWLVHNGYMVLENQHDTATLVEMFGRDRPWENVDWSKTRAYALGLGQIYINLKGREARGAVLGRPEYKALQEEIASKLVGLKDPDTGDAVFRAIYKRDDIYKGEFLNNAPDLQVGFCDGYRVGWQDTLGIIRRTVVENNSKRWSGDHCGTAIEMSGGVFFSNRKIMTSAPNILDLAPTILKLLDVALPDDLDGKPILVE